MFNKHAYKEEIRRTSSLQMLTYSVKVKGTSVPYSCNISISDLNYLEESALPVSEVLVLNMSVLYAIIYLMRRRELSTLYTGKLL